MAPFHSQLTMVMLNKIRYLIVGFPSYWLSFNADENSNILKDTALVKVYGKYPQPAGVVVTSNTTVAHSVYTVCTSEWRGITTFHHRYRPSAVFLIHFFALECVQCSEHSVKKLYLERVTSNKFSAATKAPLCGVVISRAVWFTAVKLANIIGRVKSSKQHQRQIHGITLPAALMKGSVNLAFDSDE